MIACVCMRDVAFIGVDVISGVGGVRSLVSKTILLAVLFLLG